ncbi:unnamed protein product [Rangifer tarandus platyrhynchus]|uniref:Uncharacterized protein n=1 Tax=Rangifer tarandus platyrhynchus TaxID=3082113 RepID=A0AC59ZRE8_RANTA
MSSGDHEGGCENAPHKEGLVQKDLTPAASSGVPGLSLCTQGGAAARVQRLVSFHQPDSICSTPGPGAANSPRGGARFVPRLRSPASPGAGASMRAPWAGRLRNREDTALSKIVAALMRLSCVHPTCG